MTEFPFELVDVNDSQVILKNLAKDSLSVAKHPYISGDIDYITVTRGSDHTLTTISEDGKTSSFNWGSNGYTMISSNAERLKKACVEFIEMKENIILEAASNDKPRIETVEFNKYYKQWQAWFDYGKSVDSQFDSRVLVFLRDVKTEAEANALAQRFIDRFEKDTEPSKSDPVERNCGIADRTTNKPLHKNK